MPNTVAENLQRLKTAKTAIGNAITAKGGTVGANDGLEEFASDIATIPSGGESNLIFNINCEPLTNSISETGFFAKTWNGLTDFNGSKIWTDGNNIYYSNASNQYVLDKDTSTWSAKTWNGFTDLDGSNIWTDGENIFYSSGTNQYVLNKTTSTWSKKTWSSQGITSFDAYRLWTDGKNIYWSSDTNQYVLKKIKTSEILLTPMMKTILTE